MSEKKLDIIKELCEVRSESEEMILDVMSHFDVLLDKVDLLSDSKDLNKDINNIKNHIFITMESMQVQDFIKQRIERVINEIEPNNDKHFSKSAKHIAGDTNSDIVSDDELENLILNMNK